MKHGFTLIEVMIVVAIIVSLAAIAIPNLMRAKVNANESVAIGVLKTILNAAAGYRAVNPRYPLTLASLGPGGATPPYIDAALSNGTRQGYSFRFTGSSYTFTADARPQTFGTTGVRSFVVDETGEIRYCSTQNCNPTNGTPLP